MTKYTPSQVNYDAYFETVLWSETDGEEHLDSNYSLDDFARNHIGYRKQVEDCQNFIRRLESVPFYDECTLLEKALEYASLYLQDSNALGHILYDFWLTRNGHDAGFWDGDYGEIGERLTKITEEFGSVDVYVGDNNLIYFST